MTLMDVIAEIHSLNADQTIYAAQPWTHESRAIVACEPDAGGLPSEAALFNLQYFLEVSVAQEILEDWLVSLPSVPTPTAKCDRLIHYAAFDA